MKLDKLPRIPLAFLPTPLQDAPRLAHELGLSWLLVKRDDNTGLATGGNKARKLEFLMAEAVQQDADVVLTAGGIQSNHARQTAAAAAKLGMDSILFLNDPDPGIYPGNLTLDILFNAGLHFCPEIPGSKLLSAMERYADELRASGWKPYVIPVGGSNAVGAAGYVLAMREIAEQCRELGIEDPQIFMANGSGGTQAGMTVGAKLFMPGASINGVSVSRLSGPARAQVSKVVDETIRHLDARIEFKPDELIIHDQYIGSGYAVPTEEGKEAILLAARTEGLVLDPVYTGKAMAGLIDLARKGALDPERPTIFWHTGGQAGLLATPDLFAPYMRTI